MSEEIPTQKPRPFGFTEQTQNGPQRGVIHARSRKDAAARVTFTYGDRATLDDEPAP